MKVKPFWKNERLKNFITPDFFLAIILLCIAVRFSSEVPFWFDIAQSDDNDYMYSGFHFFENFSVLEADWSPLYQLWFYTIYLIVPDPTKVYYISMQMVGILIPVFSFLLLRRVQVTRWLATATAAFILASYAIWMTEPRVTSFAALILLVLWWATSFLKERWQRLWGMATSSLFFAYSRPEFFLVTIALSLIALTYLAFSLIKKSVNLGKGDYLFIILSSGVTLLFLIWWGLPFSTTRSIYAFGQHYATNVKHCITENTPLNMPWEEILARDFNDAKNMGDVIRANSLNYRRHLICNLQAFPKIFLKVAFGSAWGSSWLLIRIWIAFILYRLFTHYKEIKRHLFWLWKRDFILFGILSLGVLTLDILFIYPREHYLTLFSIIVWILGISLFGIFPSSKQNCWRQSIAIGLSLLLIIPSLGVLLEFEIPQKPVLKTVQTINALDLKEPLRLFATQPFQPPRSEVYFDEDYVPIRYKPSTISFGEYITTHQPNIIVITKGGWQFRDDSSWIAFEENPEVFGFSQIPFDEGDALGVWKIYRQE